MIPPSLFNLLTNPQALIDQLNGIPRMVKDPEMDEPWEHDHKVTPSGARYHICRNCGIEFLGGKGRVFCAAKDCQDVAIKGRWK